MKQEIDDAVAEVVLEPKPTKADVLSGTYAASEVDAVYKGDYTGLPQRM